MAITAKTLFRGSAPTNTNTVLYTVPASTTAVVTNIIVNNISSTATTFDISLDGLNIMTQASIAAYSSVFLDIKQVLTAGRRIAGGAANTNIYFHIAGVEIS